MKTKHLLFPLIACFAILLLSCKSTYENKATVANPLCGTSWTMPMNNQYTHIKIFSDKIFVVYTFSDDGNVVAQHSGTYEVDENNLAENILYTSANKASMLGKKSALVFSIEENELKISGKIDAPNTVPFYEVWKRIYSETKLEK